MWSRIAKMWSRMTKMWSRRTNMWSRRAGLRSPIVKMFLPLGRRDSRRIICGPNWQNVATKDRMWSRSCKKKKKQVVTNCNKHAIEECLQSEVQKHVIKMYTACRNTLALFNFIPRIVVPRSTVDIAATCDTQ